MKNIIHGLCGDWCNTDSKCSKNFLKVFLDGTIIKENGYHTHCCRIQQSIIALEEEVQINNILTMRHI